MAGFLFLLVLVVLLCSALVFGQFPSCSVCGDGLEMIDREAIFRFPGQPSFPCGILEEAGKNGQIPNDSCGFLPPFISDACRCHPIGSPVAPTPMPAPIIMQPTAPGGCSVCGDGLGVSNPDGIFAFPGQPSYPCGMLEQAGLDGFIPNDGCSIFPSLPIFMDVCNCTPLTLSPAEPTVAAPIAPTTPAPETTTMLVPSSEAPAVVDSGVSDQDEEKEQRCSICGDGLRVSAHHAMFDLNLLGPPVVSCGVLEELGANGDIKPLDRCTALPSIIFELCKCIPIEAPVSPPSVTPPTTNSSILAPSPIPAPTRPHDGAGVSEQTNVSRADGRDGILISMVVLAFTLMVIMTIMVLRGRRRKRPRCRRRGHESDGGATVTTEFDDKQKEDASLSQPANEGVAEDVVKPSPAAAQVEYPKNVCPPQ